MINRINTPKSTIMRQLIMSNQIRFLLSLMFFFVIFRCLYLIQAQLIGKRISEPVTNGIIAMTSIGI